MAKSANNVYPARRNAVVDPGRRRRPDGFSFLSQNHTATQSAFAEPWKAITGGMNSGFQPKPNNSITPPPQVAMQAMASTPLCKSTALRAPGKAQWQTVRGSSAVSLVAFGR